MFYGICASSLEEALSLSKEYEMTAMQVYSPDPFSFKEELPELLEFRKNFQKTELKLVIHATIVANLVSEKIRTRQFSINSIIMEMHRTNTIGGKYLVVHPGSSGTSDGIQLLADSLNTIKTKISSYRRELVENVCIENMVGSGTQLMHTPEDFAQLFSLIDIPQVSICLDTAHAWGAGFTPKDFILRLQELGLEDKLKIVHFNNSKSSFASKKERHAILSEGVIPQEEIIWMFNYLHSHPEIIVIEEQPKNSDLNKTINYLKENIR